MSKQQRASGKTGDGTKVSDIKIQKFRDLTQYQKDRYQLTGKFSIPILKTITNKFSPQVMFTIVLPNQAISSIDALSECQNLMILNLSHNSIENLAPLKNSKQLKIINFADNSIPNLNALSGCKDLVNVHIQGNMIKGIDQIQALKECPSLKNVHLQTLSGDFQNPICNLNNYRENVLQFLEQIKRLDSIPKGLELHNGSQLKLGKKKQIKIQLKSSGPFYTSKFPPNPPYTVPNFPGEQPLKKAIASCKTSINNLQIRMKAALAI